MSGNNLGFLQVRAGNECCRKKEFVEYKHIYYCFVLISFDYEDAGYQTAELVKMDILLNGNIVEELVTVVHK